MQCQYIITLPDYILRYTHSFSSILFQFSPPPDGFQPSGAEPTGETCIFLYLVVLSIGLLKQNVRFSSSYAGSFPLSDGAGRFPYQDIPFGNDADGQQATV